MSGAFPGNGSKTTYPAGRDVPIDRSGLQAAERARNSQLSRAPDGMVTARFRSRK
jgi:hypothetical protein